MEGARSRVGAQPALHSDDTFHGEAEPPLGQLLRQLSDDATRLIRQEVGLARIETKEAVNTLTRQSFRFAIAAAIGMLAAMALLAFLILGLGVVLGNHWLAALAVAVVLGLVSALLAGSAARQLKRDDLVPFHTISTLREDARWAKREAREVTTELRENGLMPS